MTQEQKDLLLKDLCARLPHVVKVSCIDDFNHNWYNLELVDVKDSEAYISTCEPYYSNKYTNIESIKPYLFPLSSMTEEQKREYNFLKHEVPVCHYEYGDVVEDVELFDSPESFEYLIENHFDGHGLIPLGLANDATGLNIY